MADQILEKVQDALEGPIDFAGQKKVEVISTASLIFFGVVAFFVGWVSNSIHYTLWTGLFGTLMTFVMVVPAWPAWNEDPETWLRSTKDAGGMAIEVDGKKIN